MIAEKGVDSLINETILNSILNSINNGDLSWKLVVERNLVSSLWYRNRRLGHAVTDQLTSLRLTKSWRCRIFKLFEVWSLPSSFSKNCFYRNRITMSSDTNDRKRKSRRSRIHNLTGREPLTIVELRRSTTIVPIFSRFDMKMKRDKENGRKGEGWTRGEC